MILLNSPLKPDIKKLEKYLKQINNNGWYTNFGPLHNELTARLEEYLGVKNLLLVNNGTSALQVAGKALGTTSILSTPFSFVATASAFMWQKDDVIFSDVDRLSYNLCPTSVQSAYQKGCKADTVVATHVYGNPCDIEAFKKLRKQNHFKLIYDAAHAFGIKVDGESILNYGDASTLSFHATKIFHTVEGGAIVFKNKDNFDKAKELINFGITTEQTITNIGINAKLNEYQAAVGLINLNDIDNILEHRANLFDTYRKGLSEVVEMPIWHAHANTNGAYMPIMLKNRLQRENVGRVLSDENIQYREYFSSSLDTIFEDNYSYGTKNSQEISDGVLCLPLHAHMTLDEVFIVIENIKKGMR